MFQYNIAIEFTFRVYKEPQCFAITVRTPPDRHISCPVRTRVNNINLV